MLTIKCVNHVNPLVKLCMQQHSIGYKSVSKLRIILTGAPDFVG
ncbi:hypothetical protein SAMN05421821_105253 [Mucilaginibacter lappiensis]|uniref:Uncharacterized protein n=1 Tax=Mucilaginibacter lappiensis TaxID=354630 RepID=A0A1N6YRQ6_9SPHI|nr:hypothetical protein [Mucilaginibacter lappiensis]MBB6130914.1 hypothetical protein [Mucilaginibacter lappiensis]SIR17119.1 hypothetical protein SAMN05421821_105253 [Mucilaginibacter lappiensis]